MMELEKLGIMIEYEINKIDVGDKQYTALSGPWCEFVQSTEPYVPSL
jgi:hypothetical protein